MSDYINNEIIEYINENFKNITDYDILKDEIDIIINNLEKTVCAIPYPSLESYNINGINETNSGINFSYLIPNLFRSCYLNDSLKIPNICPTFIYKTSTTRFFPLLASENIIKSFLYFNFPVNITSYNINNNYLEKIINLKYQLYKKKYNTTYGSYTNPLDLYNEIYSSNSMLTQMITFGNYLSSSNNAMNMNININTFDIPWDFTYKCLCYEGILDDTYIAGNNNYDYNITNSYANLIYIITNLDYNTENIKLFIYELFIENSLKTLLKYVKSVFEDILIQLQYYISGKDYCEKDYMNITNIPTLLKLYKKFYNNQITTYKKSLKSTSIVNITPKKITILDFANKFFFIYFNEIGNYYVKYFTLNGADGPDALIFFSNIESWVVDIPVTETIIFYYFYLNIYYPSGVQLNNIYLDSDNPYTTYVYLDDFVTDFNIFFQSSKGSGITYPKIVSNKYIYAQGTSASDIRTTGNYPGGGTLAYDPNVYPNSQNFCYINSYYAYGAGSELILSYTIYLSLQTYSPYDYDDATGTSTETSGYGVSLILYQNFNN